MYLNKKKSLFIFSFNMIVLRTMVLGLPAGYRYEETYFPKISFLDHLPSRLHASDFKGCLTKEKNLTIIDDQIKIEHSFMQEEYDKKVSDLWNFLRVMWNTEKSLDIISSISFVVGALGVGFGLLPPTTILGLAATGVLHIISPT